jgi:hypothetical protein
MKNLEKVSTFDVLNVVWSVSLCDTVILCGYEVHIASPCVPMTWSPRPTTNQTTHLQNSLQNSFPFSSKHMPGPPRAQHTRASTKQAHWRKI